MKIIHGDGFTAAELKSYKPTICDNLVHSMRAVLEAMGALQINLGDQVRSNPDQKHKKKERGEINIGQMKKERLKTGDGC